MCTCTYVLQKMLPRLYILLEAETDTNDRNNPPCPGNSQSESRTHAQWEYGPLNGIPGATDTKQYKHTLFTIMKPQTLHHMSVWLEVAP